MRGVVDTGLRQPLFRGLARRLRDGKQLAAAADRRQQADRLARNEDEQRSGDRLLKRFEQRIRRRSIHRFGRIDQNHSGALTVRSDVQEIVERANLSDSDLRTGLFTTPRLDRFNGISLAVGQRIGLQQAKIGVIALRQPAAGRTNAAGFGGSGRRLAEQRLGKAPRRSNLPIPR